MGGAAAALKVSTRLGWKSHWREMQVLPTTFWEGSCPRRLPFLRLEFGALLPTCREHAWKEAKFEDRACSGLGVTQHSAKGPDTDPSIPVVPQGAGTYPGMPINRGRDAQAPHGEMTLQGRDQSSRGQTSSSRLKRGREVGGRGKRKDVIYPTSPSNLRKDGGEKHPGASMSWGDAVRS